MSSSKQNEKRRQMLPDRKLQIRFTLRITSIACACTILFFGLSVLAPAVFGKLIRGTPDWSVLKAVTQIEVLVYGVFLPLLGTYLVLLGLGLKESFAIAGPALRFRTVFADMERGTIPRGVGIRAKDYLQDTAHQLDQTLILLHDRVQRLQGLSQEAQNCLAGIASASGDKDQQQLQSTLDQIHEELGSFRLCGPAPACQPHETPSQPQVTPADQEPVASLEAASTPSNEPAHA